MSNRERLNQFAGTNKCRAPTEHNRRVGFNKYSCFINANVDLSMIEISLFLARSPYLYTSTEEGLRRNIYFEFFFNFSLL